MINLYQVSDIQYDSDSPLNILIFYNTFDYSEVVTIGFTTEDDAIAFYAKIMAACRPIDFDNLDISEIRD
jgi:hypothetical protein